MTGQHETQLQRLAGRMGGRHKTPVNDGANLGQYLVCAQHAAEDVDHVGGDCDYKAVVAVAIGVNQELCAEPATPSVLMTISPAESAGLAVLTLCSKLCSACCVVRDDMTQAKSLSALKGDQSAVQMLTGVIDLAHKLYVSKRWRKAPQGAGDASCRTELMFSGALPPSISEVCTSCLSQGAPYARSTVSMWSVSSDLRTAGRNDSVAMMHAAWLQLVMV